MPIDVAFASERTPPEPRAAFNEFAATLPPRTPHRELTAEVIWSALHGLATLTATGRIPPEGQDERVDILLSGVVADDTDQGTPA